jgi:hypothetical protein
VSTLDEIEAAVKQLPPPQQEELLFSLTLRLQARKGRVPATGRSVLEISPVSVKKVLCPLSQDEDVLGEMLEGRS